MERTSQDFDDLTSEIESRMGVCPSFFLLPDDLAVSQQLWAAACFGYLDAPFPPLFKERLFAYLSRFCKAPYCVTRHAAFLLGAGNVSGDSSCPPMSPEAVVNTLQERLPSYTEVSRSLGLLAEVQAPFDQWGEEAENSLFPCLAAVFLRTEGSAESENELRRLFGAALYDRLVWFLGFIRTAHFWTETHPELELESDARELLDEHPEVVYATSFVSVSGRKSALAEKTVLVVDDDEAILDSLKLLLEFEGISVVTCETGTDALRHFSTAGDGVDLVMIDVTLQEMSGPECLARIRELRPDIPAVLVSGFNESDLESPLKLDERTRYLAKPCPRSSLIDLLNSLFENADESAV
jgi:CheY-like chemotaxis protein